MKIGITERGDASIDYSWVEKLNSVDGAVLITKNVTDKFIEIVLPFKDKVILHATVTGYGHTKLEPHVPHYKKSMNQIYKLIQMGFPKEHIVLRIDPIIPTDKGLALFDEVFRSGYAIGLRRFRISVLDMYPHVRERFAEAGLPNPYGDGKFSASDLQFKTLNNLVTSLKLGYPGLSSIECCAEPRLTAPVHNGCISKKDLKILGLNTEYVREDGFQRNACLCLSCKTELLNNKYRCPNGCLYCYWQDRKENTK